MLGVEPDIPGLSGAGQDPKEMIDATVPHSARIWNYWLGGKDYYPIDKLVGDQLSEIFPAFPELAREDRYFLARAVRYLAEQAGIRQFIDIGAGLPAVENTHEIAQRAARSSRVVYVDNDALVITYARAMLTSGPEGACGYVKSDLREPADILAGAAATLDLTQPVAVMLLAVLGHIREGEQARSIVTRLMDSTTKGSYLVIALRAVVPRHG